MLTPKLQVLQQTIKRLLRRGAQGPLVNVLNKTHAADLAFILPHFSPAERVRLVDLLADDERRAQVLSEVDPEVAAEVLERIGEERASEVMRAMEPDDVSDILEALPEELSEALLRRMRGAERHEVEELARYDSATAGGIMSPRFFALNRDTTAREAIERLQELGDDLEMVFYVYVVNERGQLLGVISLRQLVTTPPDTRLFDIMTSELITVTPEVDQEEVAKLASRYGLLAIPVVDEANRLLGIVTVDDVIDVLQEEATEDILRMAGAGDELAVKGGVLAAVARRFPWLLATGVGGAVSAVILKVYAEELLRFVPLILFIPYVLAVAGVVGHQSATIVAQRIVQGRLQERGVLQVLRQGAVGLLLGIVFASLAVGVVLALERGAGGVPLGAALAVAAGVAAAMTAAAVLGAALPLVFSRARLDPSLAAGPFVAMAVDLLGLLLFLAIASRIIDGR